MRLIGNKLNVVILFSCISFAENYRLQSAYEKNLIIKMVLVSEQLVSFFLMAASMCLGEKPY